MQYCTFVLALFEPEAALASRSPADIESFTLLSMTTGTYLPCLLDQSVSKLNTVFYHRYLLKTEPG